MRLDAFTLRRLRYFVEIAASGSFSAAARKLNIAQPALTHQMHELEKAIGQAVFVRSSKGIDLTSSGRALLHHAKVILSDIATAEVALGRLAGDDAGPPILRIGVNPSVYDLASELVSKFAALVPDTRLRISEIRFGQCYDLITSGRLDLAVTIGDDNWSGALKLGSETLCLVTRASRENARSTTISFTDLADVECLITSLPDNRMREQLEELSNRVGVGLRVRLEMEGIAERKKAVAMGLGSAILPSRNVSEECRAGTLHAQRIVEPEFTRSIVLRARPGFPDALLNRYLPVFKAVFGRSHGPSGEATARGLPREPRP